MWYKNSYRRHLCDMHIEEWNDDFLSEFSHEDYYNNLAKMHVDNAMIYLQSHTGYCNYPTASGHMHKAFLGRENEIKLLIDKCRSNGITVEGYYSVIYNNWAHDTYPAWRMVDKTGYSQRSGNASKKTTLACSDSSGNRYGLCCPNNPDYREFVIKQIHEMLEYAEMDGMFFDMLYWPHMCYCKHCKKRWESEVGGEIPDENADDETIRLHLKKRSEWMGEFAELLARETRKIKPNLSIEHNVATAVVADYRPCCGEAVAKTADFAGGDLYGGSYEQSFVCKMYRNLTQNQPFEYMLSRCAPNLSKHTTTKSDDMLESAISLTTANHGATLVIDAIDPKGTMDSRVYEKIGTIFKRSEKYESYLTGRVVADAGVYYSLKSKFYSKKYDYSNHDCCVNAVRTLIENHVLTDVCGSFSNISNYKILIAPCLTESDKDDAKRLEEYVKNGGVLYLSGGECKDLLEEFFGTKCRLQNTETKVSYIAPIPKYEPIFEYFNRDFPMQVEGAAPILEKTANAEVLANITLPYNTLRDKNFASIHSDPPGIITDMPAIMKKKYGAGTVIWSAVPIEKETIYEYKMLFMNLIFSEYPKSELRIKTDAPADVEFIVYQREKSVQINAVHFCDSHFAETVRDFSFGIKSEKQPKCIKHIGGKDAEFLYKDGLITFNIKELKIYKMFEIEF